LVVVVTIHGKQKWILMTNKTKNWEKCRRL